MSCNVNLSQLFEICCNITYDEIGRSANFAIRREEDTLYIFFEASSGATDWRINFNFPPKAYKRFDTTVFFAHRGFLNTWAELEATIRKEIANCELSKIISVGYSHGAALAMLCHEYIWFLRPDLRRNIEGYAFGGPRVLWGVCPPSLKCRWEKFFIIRNIDDIVTHLPPAILGYRHVGNLIKIGSRGKYSPTDAHRDENILRELRVLDGTSSAKNSKGDSDALPLSLHLIRL